MTVRDILTDIQALEDAWVVDFSERASVFRVWLDRLTERFRVEPKPETA